MSETNVSNSITKIIGQIQDSYRFLFYAGIEKKNQKPAIAELTIYLCVRIY